MFAQGQSRGSLGLALMSNLLSLGCLERLPGTEAGQIPPSQFAPLHSMLVALFGPEVSLVKKDSLLALYLKLRVINAAQNVENTKLKLEASIPLQPLRISSQPGPRRRCLMDVVFGKYWLSQCFDAKGEPGGVAQR
ncbi:hypothetical protein DV515_00013967 [Chloebia gouldiae]|uniref:TGF-beta propeptide domain-containing protein n=1 Tax=Chloebia gouldiae TaxID=44316 RepID=A0A3L8S0K1_CHLGU|nr:hypothetical protein DV515_00013967 [Chloebia gouldiae]